MNKEQYKLHRKLKKLSRQLSEATHTAAQIDAYCATQDFITAHTALEADTLRDVVDVTYSLSLDLMRRVRQDYRKLSQT